MGMWIGRNRKARVTYGFDEIALVPGRVTINPNEVDIAWRLPRRDAEPLDFKIPILASAMDGVVDVLFAIEMSKLGGLAVLNLEGVQTRYKNPKEVLHKIVEADKADLLEKRLKDRYFKADFHLRDGMDLCRAYFRYQTFQDIFPGRKPDFEPAQTNG